MIVRTQEEIMRRWTGQERPLVSICCTAYNHAPYIADALDGFLMQKTAFPFEVLIHDDASTDATPAIIAEYARCYPDLIKPVYQTENQYSRGVWPNQTYNIPRARGEFIAPCEGDDYWTDRGKLQAQVDALRRHPECAISFHPTLSIRADGEGRDRVVCRHSDRETIISVERVIRGGGEFMPTASIMYRTECAADIVAFFQVCPQLPVADYFVQILCAMKGGALFLPMVFSVYRMNAPGSWSARLKTVPSLRIDHARRCLAALDRLDEFTGHSFTSEIERMKRSMRFRTLLKPTPDMAAVNVFFEENAPHLGPLMRLVWPIYFRCRFLHPFHPVVFNCLKSLLERH